MDTITKKSNHGANVRRWREWRNIKQEVLAEQLGVSQATFSGYEKKEKLEPELLDKIAKALDVPVEAIAEMEQGSSINIYSGTWQDNASAGVRNRDYAECTFNPLEKVVELYERMLKEKDNIIELLQEALKDKK